MPGTLYVVATPIGNLEDVTARALRILQEVALIAAEDTRRTAHLLARYAITTPTTSLHAHNETRKTPAIIDRLLRGDSVALVSDAGTPLISDPGEQLIPAAIAAGIRVEPIPGPSAVMAALSVAGVSTTRFSFLGFPPTRSKDRKIWLDELGRLDHTVVFFEAPHRIRQTLQHLMTAIGDCPISVCRELTKIHESLVKGPISKVLSTDFEARGEITVIVDLGHKMKQEATERASDGELLFELGQLIDIRTLSRRKAMAEIARRHQMSPNQVYDAIERAKKLSK
jgi:16S rRNA (cytidine1402-2'-O)-methyltransferase